jgi:hypothetical protein
MPTGIHETEIQKASVYQIAAVEAVVEADASTS